jgi:hypothetical protein
MTRTWGRARFCLIGAIAMALIVPLSSQLADAQTPMGAAGCEVFPLDNIWNTRIDTLPVAAQSQTWIETIGSDGELRADFGAGLWEGAPIGIPWIDVPAGQPRVDVVFGYDDESDPGPYPIPPDAPVEGGPDGNGDRHVIVVERDTCTLYELFNAFPQDDGSWTADSGAVFDLDSNHLRPDGWTSADAAGLPMLPGLVRYDEVAAGTIRHALRFTVPQTQRASVWPARHFASDLTGAEYPSMGQRFRLRADFDVSTFPPEARAVLRALQAYGMILADNGSPWFLSGVPDERWDNDALQTLRRVVGSDFEAVDVSSLIVQPDSGRASSSEASDPDGEGKPIPADLYVDGSNATGHEDGSIDAPFTSIQAAIDAAVEGMTIAVAGGTYRENIRVERNAVWLLGGFTDGFTARDSFMQETTLQGDGTDSVVTLIEAGASTIDGFTILGGGPSRTPEYGHVGAGVYVQGGSPMVSNNLIQNNDARPVDDDGNDSLGGGIYASDSDITIIDNVIAGNLAGRGGGIAINGGHVVIRDNTVGGNRGVSDHGGGLYVAAPEVVISHNRIVDNEIGRELGYGWGGGVIVYGQGTSATLSFNDIARNTAPSAGAGVFVDDGAIATLDHELVHDNDCPTSGGAAIYVDGYDTIGSHVTLDHVTVAGHDCQTPGGNGLYVEVNSTATITNSIFWGNGGDDFLVDQTSRIHAGYTLSDEALPGVGNVSSDPLFFDPDYQDYHVRSTSGRWDPNLAEWSVDGEHSPAIDAADPNAPWGQEPGPNGSRANLGADGNTSTASMSD